MSQRDDVDQRRLVAGDGEVRSHLSRSDPLARRRMRLVRDRQDRVARSRAYVELELNVVGVPEGKCDPGTVWIALGGADVHAQTTDALCKLLEF